MEKVSWFQFDGTLFQEFCNALLLSEVSPHAKVYSAPGKDAGIDQLFSGDYDNRSGNWRFQDKFHNSGNLSKDREALKRDIKKDIQANFSGEQHIVYLTNVNFLPAQEKDLLAIANETLIVKSSKTIAEVHIWHHAKICALLPKHPLLYHWYWRPNPFLYTFRQYFADQLDYKSGKSLFQLGNLFAGRKKELQKLTEFLTSDVSTLILAGNGGMGKTRLCIEFFKQLEVAGKLWLPVVLTETNFETKEFEKLLLTKQQLVILLDDSHQIKPEVIREIKRLADASKGKIKLLFTVRRNFNDQVIRNFASHNRQSEKILLDRLTEQESKDIFKQELPDLDDYQLTMLSQKSSGVPFVILSYCESIRLDKNAAQVTELEAFVEHLCQILHQTEEALVNELAWPKDKIRCAIRNICLFHPISNNVERRSDLLTLFDLKEDELTFFLNRACKVGLMLENDHELSLSPDPYRDFILAEHLKDAKLWLSKTLQNVSSISVSKRIVQNLLQVLAYKNSLENLNIFINRWIDYVKSPDLTALEFEEILDLVQIAVFFIPDIGAFFVNNVLDVYENKNSILHAKRAFWDNGKSVFMRNSQTLQYILQSTFINSDAQHLQRCLPILERYCQVLGQFNVIHTCFAYRLDDFSWEGYKPTTECGRQIFLKNLTLKYLRSSDGFKVKMAIYACEVLLYDRCQDYFHVRVPDRLEVKTIHADLIPAMIEFCQVTTTEYRENVLDHLIKRLYDSVIFLNEQGQTFDWSENVVAISSFLEEYLNESPSVNERYSFLKTFREKTSVKIEYDSLIERLVTLSWTTSTRKDRLHLLILYSDGVTDNGYFVKEVSLMVEYVNDLQLFANDMTEIGQSINALQPSSRAFKKALNVIAIHFSHASKIMADYFANFTDMASDRMLLLRGNCEDEKYFYKAVDEYWQTGTPQNRENAIWLLTFGRNNRVDLYQQRDFDYFEYVVKEKNQRAVENMLRGLVGYARINKLRAFNLMADILENFEVEHFDLLDNIFEQNESFQLEFKEDIRLLIQNTVKLSIPERDMVNILNWLEKQFGFEIVLDYLKQRYEFYIANRHDNNFEWNLPKALNRNQFDEVHQVKAFRHALEWYIFDVNEKHSLQKTIVNYFLPNSIETHLLVEEIFLPVGERCQNLPENLSDLSEIVHEFGVWQEPIIRFLIQVAEWYLKTSNSQIEEVNYILGFGLLNNIGHIRYGHEKKDIPDRFKKWYNLMNLLKEEPHHRIIIMLFKEGIKKADQIFREKFGN